MKLNDSSSFPIGSHNTETYRITLSINDGHIYVQTNTIHSLTNTHFNATDVHFIGRRVKVEKFLRDMNSNLNLNSKQSRKRKSRSDENGVDNSLISGKVLKEENQNETIILEERESSCVDEKFKRNVEEVSTITDREVNIEKSIQKRDEIHLLSDLRGLTNLQEKVAQYYAAQFFCSGGDNSCKKLSKYFDNKFVETSLKSKEMTSSSTTSFSTSISSNSTTVMDFER